ncbi:uncharacterized protein LOC141657438 isoform X2 [Silene latifolia]|uniref:uncharacterized protein LOC141657438 isoform X2 n=1 Tax=Silene latifolia TaxID=37657 RepID=UPI003D775EEA
MEGVYTNNIQYTILSFFSSVRLSLLFISRQSTKEFEAKNNHRALLSQQLRDSIQRLNNIMEKDSYEEKSSSQDDNKFTGLVDYSSSSEDEDHVPLVKKRGLSDSELNTSLNADGSSKSDSEEEDWTVMDDSSSNDDIEMEYDNYVTDNDLLDWGPYSWRRDRWKKREVYVIVVEGESREESRCLELLKEIGCEERFLGCSIEMDFAFFARLNKDEATKIQGLKGVREVVARRFCYGEV